MAVPCNKVHILKINGDERCYDNAKDAAKNGTPFVATKEEERVTHIYDRMSIQAHVLSQHIHTFCIWICWNSHIISNYNFLDVHSLFGQFFKWKRCGSLWSAC